MEKDQPEPSHEPATFQPAHALPITGSPLPEFDFEAALGVSPIPSCGSYASIYAKKASEESDVTRQALLQSLGFICSFHPNYEVSAEPYTPLYQSSNGSRSLIPGDLTEDDLNVVADLYDKSNNPALRARLGDVLWIRKRNHKAARAIIDDYIQVSNRLMLLQGRWAEGIRLLRRAIQLGKGLGKTNEGWKLAEGAFLNALANPLSDALHDFSSHLFAIAHDYAVGDTKELAMKARVLAERAHSEKDFRRARIYLDHESRFWKYSKDTANEQAARLASALTYPDEVQAHLASASTSYMLLADVAAKGIEVLRQIKGPSDIIAQLRRHLSEFQQKSLGELQTFRSPKFDISDEVDAAVKFVETPDFETALLQLALGFPILDVIEFRKEILEHANQAPLSFLMTGNFMDEKGRPTSKLGGLPFSGGDEFEKNLEAHMFHQAALFRWKHRVAALLDPARLKIWSDHLPTPNDFGFLVVNNPFIPPGHEGIFLRGLYYGLAGDFLLSSHLLTPQIENSMRYVLEQRGVDVSILKPDLTQPVKILGGIFDLPETQKIFGADICFELRGHLIEKPGYSFRNNIAHGFLSEAECYGYAAVNVWWLTLRLCYLGFGFPEIDENDVT
jgi:hypothetical protein